MPENIPTAGAVDLAEVKARADARDEALADIAEQKRATEIQQRAASWDKNMTRAFKGIFPAPLRRNFLRRAIDAEDQR